MTDDEVKALAEHLRKTTPINSVIRLCDWALKQVQDNKEREQQAAMHMVFGEGDYDPDKE